MTICTSSLVELVPVSPELAKEWLKKLSTKQRRKTDAFVRSLAMLMRAGQYFGDCPQVPISFDVDGMLINGQHRLEAIILSGTTQLVPVQRGVAKDRISIIDHNQRVRTSHDLARIDGIDIPANVIPVVDAILSLSYAAYSDKAELVTVSSSRRIPHHLRREFCQTFSIDKLHWCDGFTKHGTVRVRLNNAAIKTAAILCEDTGYPVDEWRDRLVFGLGLSRNDPFRWLREEFLAKGAGIAAKSLFVPAMTAMIRAHEGKSSYSINKGDNHSLVREWLRQCPLIQKWAPVTANYFGSEK